MTRVMFREPVHRSQPRGRTLENKRILTLIKGSIIFYKAQLFSNILKQIAQCAETLDQKTQAPLGAHLQSLRCSPRERLATNALKIPHPALPT